MDNFLYFFISYPKAQKENPNNITFVVPEKNEQKPECIHSEEIYDNKQFYYKKIFKVNKSAGTGKNLSNYYFEFETGEYKYIISFNNKGSSFIYDPKLEVEKRRIEIKRKVNQTYFDYSEKLDFFESALKKNGETKNVEHHHTRAANHEKEQPADPDK